MAGQLRKLVWVYVHALLQKLQGLFWLTYKVRRIIEIVYSTIVISDRKTSLTTTGVIPLAPVVIPRPCLVIGRSVTLIWEFNAEKKISILETSRISNISILYHCVSKYSSCFLDQVSWLTKPLVNQPPIPPSPPRVPGLALPGAYNVWYFPIKMSRANYMTVYRIEKR